LSAFASIGTSVESDPKLFSGVRKPITLNPGDANVNIDVGLVLGP